MFGNLRYSVFDEVFLLEVGIYFFFADMSYISAHGDWNDANGCLFVRSVLHLQKRTTAKR